MFEALKLPTALQNDFNFCKYTNCLQKLQPPPHSIFEYILRSVFYKTAQHRVQIAYHIVLYYSLR